MQCPVCSVALVMADRGGVEIDYCPKCRGIWLDRGELDKIIERSEGVTASVALNNTPPLPMGRHGSHDHDHHDRDHHDHGRSEHGRKSFWREIFD